MSEAPAPSGVWGGVRYIAGPTILLASGEYLDLSAPEGCAFRIEDIAHGLAHVCRFAGQCPRFYSVAEHSVYVSRIVPPEHALAALLHDAAEAFIGDVTRPLKSLLPDYRAVETRVEAALFARHGIALPLHPSIKEADMAMLATEQSALWGNLDISEGCGGAVPLRIEIAAYPPKLARVMFLDRYRQLGGAG